MRNMDPDELLARADAAMAQAVKEDEPERLSPITTLTLDVQGTRRRYEGTFYFKVPTIQDQLRIATIKRGFLPAGAGEDIKAAQLADVIAYLTVTIQFSEDFPRPKWWAPMEAYDSTPYAKLYEEALDYEDRFHGRHAVDRADGDGAAGEGERDRDGAVSLGGEVRPATQRRETLAGDGA